MRKQGWRRAAASAEWTFLKTSSLYIVSILNEVVPSFFAYNSLRNRGRVLVHFMRCCSRKESFHRNFVAVGSEGREPFQIRPQDGGAMRRQALQHLGVGVAERVLKTIRNQRKS